jgi:hypothetical protein
MYLYVIQNPDYYLWHLYKINNNILIGYIIYYVVLALLFFNFFPIIALIPEWHKVLNTNGVGYSIAICS